MSDCQIDLYDSEIIAIEGVLNAVKESQGQRRDMEGFRQEVVERFAEIGLVVTCNVYSTVDAATGEEIPGLWTPEIVIQERCKPTPFDHARQSWEVQHDILGIDGGPATIKGNGMIGTPSKSVGFTSN